MQNYGRGRSALHEIRTIASGYHRNQFVWVVNHIPTSSKQSRSSFVLLSTNKQTTKRIRSAYICRGLKDFKCHGFSGFHRREFHVRPDQHGFFIPR